MHGKDRTTSTDRIETHRRRASRRGAAALFTGACLTLAKGEPEVGEPKSLAVVPDRSVLHTSRDGELCITG